MSDHLADRTTTDLGKTRRCFKPICTSALKLMTLFRVARGEIAVVGTWSGLTPSAGHHNFKPLLCSVWGVRTDYPREKGTHTNFITPY